jgi:aspartyl aminopeptidase
MQDENFVNGLLDFIKCSPTPFHAVQTMVDKLQAAGFQCLDEKDAWPQELSSGRYYVVRNDSSIIAFQLSTPLETSGLRMVGAHTDSPCLKVKPNPEIIKNHYLQLGVEIYGGVLLNPWFDRDLSLAGRVSYLDQQQELKHSLVNLEKAIAIIPSLAIHLDREVNQSRSINAQTDIPPILMKLPEKDVELKADFNTILRQIVNAQDPAANAERIMDYELSFYDVQPPAVIGLHDDFIAGARLDNLLSCYTGLMALLEDNSQSTLLICNDHEEVGSMSAAGAQGTFLKSVLERLSGSDERYARIVANSTMISADNAHGIHPNYADKHDSNHGPIINNGPVIKINANQRYASNSETAAYFRYLCERADVPVQSYVVRSDMACGSTIGPITASGIGVKTVDVGVPTFAMHSIRELAGRWDAFYLYRVLHSFFNNG